MTPTNDAPVTVEQGQTWQHIKRGTAYEVLGIAELQAGQPQHEKAALVIYRGDDGKLWARNSAEFMDGRFRLAALASGEQEARIHGADSFGGKDFASAPAGDGVSERDWIMRAFYAEIDRQCGIGAGMAQTCEDSGLFQINADIDMHSLAAALARPRAAVGERPDDEALDPHLPDTVKSERRCGIQRSDWMTSWFVPWSPRNDNQNAEGPWSHWVALAHAIIAADEKAILALRGSPAKGEG